MHVREAVPFDAIAILAGVGECDETNETNAKQKKKHVTTTTKAVQIMDGGKEITYSAVSV